MIRIYVKGQQLALKRDTTLTVELNNALFASPDIEGDISFSFGLPVEGNEQLLGFAHLPQIGSVKKMPCLVWCNNSQNWAGVLVVQKTGHDSLSAALVINPYPEGFAGRSLAANEDADIVISESKETHNAAWEEFLKASVNDPDVKFAPFINEDGYGSENEDFGRWNGIQRTKVVNSLFFTDAGTLLDTISHPFSKAHNELLDVSVIDTVDTDGKPTYSEYTEMNQLAFCPQIRIARILSLWCRNAGYTFIDHLGDDLSGTFLQSQKSLDGTSAQYDTEFTDCISGYAKGYATDIQHWQWYFSLIPNEGSETNIANAAVSIQETGWWMFRITADYRSIAYQIQRYFSVGYRAWLAVYQGFDKLYEYYIGTLPTKNFKVDLEWKQYVSDIWTAAPFRIAIYFKNGQSTSYYLRESLKTNQPSIPMTVDIRKISADQVQSGFNIFRSTFRIPELLPDVTNASFLKTLLETMGLCFFVSGKQKTIEVVPYSRISNAKSLDLTPYELTRETETISPDETKRTFRLKPLKDEDYNKGLRIDDVAVKLPDPYANHEHYVLRTKTNTLYHASKQEGVVENWVEGWEEYSGNPDRLEVGSGDEENREPSVVIPHQRLFSTNRRHPDTDILSGETPQLMVADFTISSDLYNTTEKPSDIILTQYRGFRLRQYGASATEIKNEVMLPVWGDDFALKAKGANSIGENYVKPVLELLGHKTVTYKFRLPTAMIQQVEDLLRPSELDPGMQTRFLIVRNVKTVPKRITFQIDNDIDDTVLCQIEAVKVY